MTSRPTDSSIEQQDETAKSSPVRPANAPAEHAGASEESPLNGSEPAAEVSSTAADMQTEVLIRKKKRHHKKRKKYARRALVALAVVAVVAAIIAIAAFSLVKSGEDAVKQAGQAEDIQTAADAVAYDEGRTVQYNGKTYALNENMVSIAVIGYDRRTADVQPGQSAGQADAVMVLAINLDDGTVSGIGIPRDSMVEVGEFMGDAFAGMSTMQLCLAYAYGDGGELSSQYTAAAVSRVLYNMPVSYYLSLDMNGVGALADAIGGVSLTPLQSIPKTNIVEGQPTVLFGDNALKYVQWRDTSQLTSSLDRQARQSQFVQAFSRQALSNAQGSVGTLVNLYNVAAEYSVTNLNVNEFTYLASSVLSTGISDVNMTTLQGQMQSDGTFAEFYLDKTNVYETVLDVYYHEVSGD